MRGGMWYDRLMVKKGKDPLRDALDTYRTLSIIGMGKNAGKTTVLNRLLSLAAESALVLALTSIGRDGETSDIVTGTKKPAIWVRRGTLIATAADMLRRGDVTPEILCTTDLWTPLGEVIVLRALSDGYVQLAGPSIAGQLECLAEELLARGADRVLIDGAVHRKSLAAPVVSEATVLCAGASYSPDMDTVVRDTAHVCRVLTLPETSGTHEHRRLLPGAATDAVLRGLCSKPGDEITVRDSSRMLASRDVFERMLAQGICFTVEYPATLCCVCVNPYSVTGPDFDAALFEQRMARAISVPVLNVRGRMR